MSASQQSLYELLSLESNDKEKEGQDLRSGAVSIDYYEDIFSPSVTAKVRIINSVGLYNSLPIRGGEKLSLKILDRGEGKKGLDFTSEDKKLYVSSVTDVLSESQRESFLLHLVSKEAITNETARVQGKYTGTIGNHVDQILSKIMKIKNRSRYYIDDTAGDYNFIGNMKKPFSVLVWLASKACPSDGNAGFLFFQTQSGFSFRAIDDMVKQDSKMTYTYGTASENGNNDDKILKYVVERNHNLVEKLRLGIYSTQRMYFDPLTFAFTQPQEGTYTVKPFAGLGKKETVFPDIDDTSGQKVNQVPTRVLSGVIDRGTMAQGVSQETNAEAMKYQSQSIMRYNYLLLQSISITVPCNTNLEAGDVIECIFPNSSGKGDDPVDGDVSGKYIIKELCHHFEPISSFTSLKLIRDTFGLYG